MTEEKLLTLNDMKEDMRFKTGDGLYADSVGVDSFKIRQVAIKWIKKDIENSTGYQPPKEQISYWHRLLPNGKYCDCDPYSKCDYHTKGKRLMELFNIAESDLK